LPGGGPPALLSRMSICGCGRQRLRAPLGTGDVAGRGDHGHAGLPADPGGCFVECKSAAGVDHQVHALLGQRQRTIHEPSPLLAPHTSAHLPRMPRSIACHPSVSW
jgi:hypothetical protein